MTRWRYATATDTGMVRETNQDALFVDDSLALVADGMGGHAAGDVASVMATEIVRNLFHGDSTVEGLYEAIEAANLAIISDAKEHPERFGMGTTVIAVGLTHDHAGVISPTLFNVGDSRAYQLRDGALRQLSEDHSVAEEWVRMGRLTPEEAITHPRRHQLTRALGVEESLEIDVSSIDAMPGDRILLCSDGLSNELSVDSLAKLASAPKSLEDAALELVTAAKHSGGRDNISVVLLEFDEVNVAANPIKRTVSTKAPPVASSPSPGRARSTRRRRVVTWRVWLGVAILVGVIAGAVAILHWYAYSSFYLADDAGKIAVYQGQPNGVLWYKANLVLDLPYSSRQLRNPDIRALRGTISEPTLGAAINFAKYMHTQWLTSRPLPPVTTSTTTTLPNVTTTITHVTTTTKPKG